MVRAAITTSPMAQGHTALIRRVGACCKRNPQLFTDLNGPTTRLRVDPAQTSFFAKREFETFREFATSTTGTYLLRVVSTVDFIIMSLGFAIEAGSVRLTTYFGGTPTGTFNESPPYLPANNMTEGPAAHTPHITLSAADGGTLSGGVLARVGRFKTADNSNFSQSLGASSDFVVARPPITYYLLLEMTGAIGVLLGRIEERT